MPKEDHNSSDRSHQGLPQGGVELSLDALAKGLASGTLSRGKAIRWMGGALLGAALASLPGVVWANDCRRLGRECRRDSQCCSRNCVRRGDDKVCGCPEGQSRCNDRCVNLQRNERHCGACFNRCAEGEECVESKCQGGVCPPGEPVCTGCACETVACTPGTRGCNPSELDPGGGRCYAAADGVGTTCVCGFGQCTNDCSVCANLGLVCVLEPEFCPGGFQCVGPCPLTA
jgi:hypothetical protein